MEIPSGVPVMMTSPGRSVVPCERKLMIFLTLKIISLVVELWTVFPFTLVEIQSRLGSLMTYNQFLNRRSVEDLRRYDCPTDRSPAVKHFTGPPLSTTAL